MLERREVKEKVSRKTRRQNILTDQNLKERECRPMEETSGGRGRENTQKPCV